MDRVAERLSIWFGSTPFILLHVVWFMLWTVLHYTMNLDPEWRVLTLIVSLEAILLALFILRGQNVQSRRHEEDIKTDLQYSRNTLRWLKRIANELKAWSSR